MSIKYYHIAKDETPPEEFCAVRDVGGEPSEYVFYVPESDVAKLRELVRRYVEYTSQDRCEGCVCKSRCNDGDIEECWQLTEIRELARELGIEVDK